MTYYVPHGTGPAEPVLYGVTSTHLWIRVLHDSPRYFLLPQSMSDDRDFVLSMTGRRSWVIDTARDGYLTRWAGHFDASLEGPVVYRAAGLDAIRVVGTCAPVLSDFPQPLFTASDGLVHLWNTHQGPIPCVTAGQDVMAAQAGARLYDGCLVYTASQNGHIMATRQVAVDGYDTRWGGSRVISRSFRPHLDNLVPMLHPASPPALFTISDTELTLLSLPSGPGTAATALGPSAWTCEKATLDSVLTRPQPAAAQVA
ncbi:hypothetical protein [Streptomyces sp. CAS3]